MSDPDYDSFDDISQPMGDVGSLELADIIDVSAIQAVMDDFYDWFVDAVARRRNLASDTVRKLATGEVFTASKAKALGLADELGDLDTAIDMATEMGKVPRRLAYLRPRRALLERLFGRVSAGLVGEVVAEVERRLLTRIEFRAPLP